MIVRTSRTLAAAMATLLTLTACLSRGVNGGDALTPTPPPSPEPGPPDEPRRDAALLVGAYWYPWYGADGRHWREGYRGTPLLGEYDSADPDVIRRQIAWASDYGVDFFAASWWGRDSFEDTVTRGPFLEVLADQPFRFAVLYEAPSLLGIEGEKIPLDDDAVRRLTNDLTYLATTYFSHPNYLQIDGRPVVFVYLTRIFSGDVALALGQVRETLCTATGTDLFLIGDEVYWHAPTPSRLSPFDGVTAYNMHTSVAGIAEGFGRRRYKQDYIRFIVIALASCGETQVHLDMLQRTGSLPEETYRDLNARYDHLGRMLNRFLQGVIEHHRESYH